MRAPLCSNDPTEILGADVIDRPHPFFARLREERPLSRIGDSGVHVVATWALVDEALNRPEDFSANLTGVLYRNADGLPDHFELPSTGATDVIATADDPVHQVHRTLVQPRLDARRIAQLEDSLRSWTRAAVHPWVEDGGGDFAPISELIPALAIARLLGLPETDVQRFRAWAMMGGDMLAGEANHARLGELAVETGQMAAYLNEHLEIALSDPDPDPGAPLFHALARGMLSGAIERAAAVGIAIVLFGAGGESTAALIGSVVRWLAGDPDLSDRLRAEPGLIPRFVEEVLRLEPPFKFHYRSVTRPCQLGGYALEPGDRLMLAWASANRDPAILEDPNTLRLDRKHPKQHMSFGRGAHFCVGAPLARLEARVVAEELLNATSLLTPAANARAIYARSIFIRRLERLPLSAAA